MAISSEDFNDLDVEWQSLYFPVEKPDIVEIIDPPKPWSPGEFEIADILRQFEYPSPWHEDSDWEADIQSEMFEAASEWLKDRLDQAMIDELVDIIEEEKEIVESILPKKMFEV